MKKNLIQVLSLFLFAGAALGYFPALTQAQENTGTSPLLVVKIPDIEQLIENIQKLAPEGTDVTAQISNLRMMLQGTDWIDTGRSIVVEMSMGNPQNPAFALIPFLAANNNFSNTFSAKTGADYYIIPVPPKPEFTVSPELEQRLVDASLSKVSGSIVVEAALSKLMAMVEPALTASLAKIDPSEMGNQPEGTSPPPLSKEEINTIAREMFAILKQADTLRLGMDVEDDSFIVLMDVEAAPGSELANAFIDIGGSSRLADYPVDMPVKFYTRAYNVAGSQKIMQSYLGTVYSMLGIDIDLDEMVRLTENLTGEQAGGLDFTSDGLVVQLAAVLKPGINGEAFLRDEYLPFIEQYGNSIAKMASEQEEKPVMVSFKRTEDSRVTGVNVMGLKINLPENEDTEKIPFDSFGLRLAATDGLLLIANDDAGIAELIEGTRNRNPVPAGGPTGRLEMDMSRLLKSIKSLVPQKDTAAEFPEDLGKIMVSFDMKDGMLTTRTSFDIELFNKLAAALKTNAAKNNGQQQETDTGGGTL